MNQANGTKNQANSTTNQANGEGYEVAVTRAGGGGLLYTGRQELGSWESAAWVEEIAAVLRRLALELELLVDALSGLPCTPEHLRDCD